MGIALWATLAVTYVWCVTKLARMGRAEDRIGEREKLRSNMSIIIQKRRSPADLGRQAQ